MRRGDRRDDNEGELVAALRGCGCDVEFAVRMPYDLVVGRAGRTYLLEVKTMRGQLKPSQIAFADAWRGHYCVVRSIDEALFAVGLGAESNSPQHGL